MNDMQVRVLMAFGAVKASTDALGSAHSTVLLLDDPDIEKLYSETERSLALLRRALARKSGV